MQTISINVNNYIIEKFPFFIREVLTNNDIKIQAKFNWHVEDLGIRHAPIKKIISQLNINVERSLLPSNQ